MFGGVSGVDEERRQSGVFLVASVGLWVSGSHDTRCFIGCDGHICEYLIRYNIDIYNRRISR